MIRKFILSIAREINNDIASQAKEIHRLKSKVSSLEVANENLNAALSMIPKRHDYRDPKTDRFVKQPL